MTGGKNGNLGKKGISKNGNLGKTGVLFQKLAHGAPGVGKLSELDLIETGLELGASRSSKGAGEPEQRQQTSPQFSVKAKDREGFVGSAWLNQGRFGKYISVRLREDAPKGTTLYLAPTKANAGILG